MVLGSHDLRGARGGCLGARVQPFGHTPVRVVTDLQGLGVDPLPWLCIVAACEGKAAEGLIPSREMTEGTSGAQRTLTVLVPTPLGHARPLPER